MRIALFSLDPLRRVMRQESSEAQASGSHGAVSCLGFLLLVFDIILVFVTYVFVCVQRARMYTIAYENNFRESVLSYHHVRLEDHTQVIRHGNKHLWPWTPAPPKRP